MRRFRPGLAFLPLLALVIPLRLVAMSLDTQGTLKVACDPPKLGSHGFSTVSHSYLFHGGCQYSSESTAWNGDYKIAASWDKAGKKAKEVIEGRDALKQTRKIRLIASCSDDPWLTNAPCTLDSLMDDDGLALPDSFRAAPYPKSRHGVPAGMRASLLAEAANAKAPQGAPPPPPPPPPATKRPVILGPSEGKIFTGPVFLLITRPSNAGTNFPSSYDVQLEFWSTSQGRYVQGDPMGSYVGISDGTTRIENDKFKTKGKWRLRARYVGDPHNEWTDWVGFVVEPPLPQPPKPAGH